MLGGRIPPLLGGLLQDDKQVIRVHLYAFFDEDFLDGPVHGGGDGGEHFHGFEEDEFVACFDFGAGGDGDFCDHAGEGGADVGGVVGVAFGAGGCGGGGEGFIDDDGFSGHSVQFEEEGAAAFVIGFTDGDEFDDEDFSGVDFDFDFFADLEAVEEGGGGEDAEVVVLCSGSLKVFVDAGIHEVAVDGVG